MTKNLEKKWRELQITARQMLDNPRLLPKDLRLSQYNQTLHLWISPTFTPEKHWVFNAPQPQINPLPKPIVQQIIWQKDKDFQQLNTLGFSDFLSIEPTFEIKTTELEWEFYRKTLSELAKIKIPPFIQAEMNGRDGEIFGIETLDLFYNGRVVWWSSPPGEWQELVDWFEKIRQFLETTFK